MDKVNKKLDRLCEAVEALCTKMDSINTKLEAHIEHANAKITELKDDLKSKDKRIQEVEESQSVLNELFEASRKDMKGINCIVKENQDLHLESMAWNKLEQYGRNSMLEFGGIPVQEGENCIDIVCKISTMTGIECTPNDVDIAHRLKKKNIIAVFNKRSMRNNVFYAKKNLKNHTVTELNLPFPTDEEGNTLPGYIFVNESLTPKNKELLYETKKECKRLQIPAKCIYTVKGQIKVKAEHYDKAVSIYDTDDIRQLKLK